VTVRPPPGVWARLAVPPFDVTSRCTMARPSPVPLGFEVLKRSDAAGFVTGPGQSADQLGLDARVVFHHEDPAKTCVHGLHV
jgi:hypothetical protein